MINILVVHGLHGDIKATYEPYLEEEMSRRNIPIFFPSFPKNEEASYSEWEKVLDEYLSKEIIHTNTIIISRCLGSRFILKYLAARNVNIKAFISIAAFLENSVGKPDVDLALKKFAVTNDELEKSIDLISYRFAIYGDKDYLNNVEKLENFADKIKANKVFVKGMGHCGNSSGVKSIPQVVEIIDELILRENVLIQHLVS